MQQFQWYPGHMTKARRAMQESIKLIDLVIEIVDARVPQASRNPDIDTLGNGKARMVILNKVDLADDKSTKIWAEHFKTKGYHVLTMDSRVGSGKKQVNQVIAEACKEKIERDRKRGILNRPVRAMVAGIPNVGKSTFINTMAGKAAAKTGNKPGVTRGNQWIRLHKNVELLDTPGILWPKFDDQMVGLRLALIGSIKDDILNVTELALSLIQLLQEKYPGFLEKRYDIEESLKKDYDYLQEIAKVRGCLMKGGEYDLDKAALLLMDDFRSGKLGRITLELPEDYDK
jgi:ribosome biogenesis GTPase A